MLRSKISRLFNYNLLFSVIFIIIAIIIKKYYYDLGFEIGNLAIYLFSFFNFLCLYIGFLIRANLGKIIFLISFILLNTGLLYNFTMFSNPMLVTMEVKYQKEQNNLITKEYIDCGVYIPEILSEKELVNIKETCFQKHFRNKKTLALIEVNYELKEKLEKNLRKDKKNSNLVVDLDIDQFINYIFFHIYIMIFILATLFLLKTELYKIWFLRLTGISINNYINNIKQSDLIKVFNSNINMFLISFIIISSLIAYYMHITDRVHFFILYSMVNITILPFMLKKHKYFPSYMNDNIIHFYVSVPVFILSIYLFKELTKKSISKLISDTLTTLIEFNFYDSFFKQIALFFSVAILLCFITSFFIVVSIILKEAFKYIKIISKLKKSDYIQKLEEIKSYKNINKISNFIKENLIKTKVKINESNNWSVLLMLSLMLPPAFSLDGGIGIFNILLVGFVLIYFLEFNFKSTMLFLYAGFTSIMTMVFFLLQNSTLEKTIIQRVIRFMAINGLFDYTLLKDKDNKLYNSFEGFFSNGNHVINEDIYNLYKYVYEGGFFGKGLGRGTSEIISNVNKDYVFASFSNQTGFFTLTMIIFLVSCFSFFSIIIAEKTKNIYFKSFAVTASGFLLISVFITVAGNLVYIPMTGYPFIPIAFSKIGNLCFIFFVVLLIVIVEVEERIKNTNQILDN